MNDTFQNRRKYKRALFEFEDKVSGIFSIPGKSERPITAAILNLSRGGIHITVDTKDESKIKPGNILILIQIKGPSPLQYLVNIDTEVKWVLDHEIMEHIGIGCEFVNISQSSLEQIGSFVDTWYADSD